MLSNESVKTTAAETSRSSRGLENEAGPFLESGKVRALLQAHDVQTSLIGEIQTRYLLASLGHD